jgi:hypothetical protein
MLEMEREVKTSGRRPPDPGCLFFSQNQKTMLGDLFGDMEEQQKELRKKLAGILVEAEVENGAIAVEANANRQLTRISIQAELLNAEEAERLEDLLLVAINRVLEKAEEKEQEEIQKGLKDMLPPGLEGLLG